MGTCSGKCTVRNFTGYTFTYLQDVSQSLGIASLEEEAGSCWGDDYNFYGKKGQTPQ